MQCPERIDSLWQRFTLFEVGGQRVRQRSGQRSADELAQLLRRDVLTRRVDRSEVRGRLALRRCRSFCVASNPAAPLATAQAHRSSRLELVFEPRLVEPGSGNGRGAVADARGQHLQPPSPTLRDRQHLTGDRNVLVCLQIRDTHLGQGHLVSKRPVSEQVAHGQQAETLELSLDGRTDARQHVESPPEEVGPRKAARARPVCRRVTVAERLLETGCRGCRQTPNEYRDQGWPALSLSCRGPGGAARLRRALRLVPARLRSLMNPRIGL